MKRNLKFLIPANKKDFMGSRSIPRNNNTSSGSLCSRNNNCCVIYSANAAMAAESVERRNQTWFCRTKAESDLIIRVGDHTFYLHKAHPNLTEEENSSICRVLDYYKLSQEACKHAMKNDRLPLNIITRFILLEQVHMTREITATGSDYQRTKTQAIVRISEGFNKRRFDSNQKEIKMMKQDVERIKTQLSELKLHKMQLQSQVRRQKLGYVSLS